jgi:hypothetical protein
MAHKFAVVAVVAASLVALPSVIFAQSAGSAVQPTQPSAPSAAQVGPGSNTPLDAPAVSVGRSIPTADGVGTKAVPAKPCTTAARETDGTTTCIGVPAR